MSEDLAIPRIIMQTWKTHDVPDRWKGSPESIKKYMSHWSYFLMSDEDNDRFVKKFFPDFLDVFRMFEYPIQRADAIRYMWLYVNGGLYLDLDVRILHPLDELFLDGGKIFLVKSSNFFTATNAMMASKPRVSLWLKCLKEMKKPLPWWCLGKHLKVMNSTGPMMLDRVAKNSKDVITHLPTRLMNPCSLCEVPCTKRGAYVQLLEGSSWVGWDSRVYQLFLCHWREIIVVVVIVAIIVLVIFIRTRGGGRA